MAKPKKSENCAPSGQSIASKTKVGDVYARAFTSPPEIEFAAFFIWAFAMVVRFPLKQRSIKMMAACLDKCRKP